MISRAQILSHRSLSIACSALLIAVSIAFTLMWWQQLRVSYDDLSQHEYSLNEASGVHVSLFTDLREPIGTKSNGNAYGYYLAELARSFGPASTGFLWTIERPGADWLAQLGNNRRMLPIAPITSDEFVLGVSRLTKISIMPLENFPPSLIGQWVEIGNALGDKIEVIVASGTTSELTIAGDVPVDFFPTMITSLKGASRPGQQTTLVSTTSLASNVRGGVISGTDGRGVYLYIPGWASKQPFRPTIGDTIRFGSGDSREIDYVMKLGGGYFVLLGGDPVQPHLFNRADIVTVTARSSAPDQGLQIRVNPVSNDQFLNGRERKMRVAINSELEIRPGTLVGLDSGARPFFVETADQKHLTIDIQTTLAVQACIALSQSSSGIHLTDIFRATPELPQQRDTTQSGVHPCLTADSTAIKSLSDQIANWQDLSGTQRQLIHSSLRGYKQISAEEVWYRSLSLDLVVATDDEDVQPDFAPVDVNTQSIWEIYPGSMANILYNKQNPAPSELLIHALSQKDRNEYYESFSTEAPDFFNFAKPRQFTPWIINWHWPLFKEVLQNYKVQYSNTDFSVWRRDDTVRYEESLPVSVSSSLPVELSETDLNDTCRYALREVKVDYEISNSVSYIPILGNSTRFLVSIEGVDSSLPPPTPISLPTEVGTFSFPVFSRAGDQPRLTLEKLGPLSSFADIQFQSVSVSDIYAGDEELEELFLENRGAQMIASLDPACSERNGLEQ